MDNTSLAAQAVANSPGVTAPASFNGVEWLVILNLWTMTTAFLVGLMVIHKLVTDWREHRHRDVDGGWTPARVWRVDGLLFATGITLRCGASALVLWAWNPRDPGGTGAFLFIQRVIDPIAIGCGVTGLFLLVWSAEDVLDQLRRPPLKRDMWRQWPMLRRMLSVGVLCGLAAFGVTVTR